MVAFSRYNQRLADHFRSLVGDIVDGEMGTRACARQNRTTRKFVRYWRRKFRDMGFHPGSLAYMCQVSLHFKHINYCVCYRPYDHVYTDRCACTYIGSWGGARNFKFDVPTQVLAEACLWYLTTHCPYLRLSEYVTHLRQEGVDISGQSGRMWVCRVFKRWGLSYKLIYYKHVRTTTYTHL
jgi:hypothetical protein